MRREEKDSPSFYDGCKVQEIMEVAQILAREKRWLDLDEV